MQLINLRQRDIDRALQIVIPELNAAPRSLIVEGLPHVGVESVFQALGDRLQQSWCIQENKLLVRMNLSLFQLREPITIIHEAYDALSKQLNTTIDSRPASYTYDLIEALRGLQRLIDIASEQGAMIIFMLDNFDVLLKLDQNDVQTILNTWQVLADEPRHRTAFVIRCYRDIGDICREANYSSYYKIFGMNHIRIGRIADARIAELVRVQLKGASDDIYTEVVARSGGFPEHTEVILRYTDAASEDLQRQALDALSSTFEEWLACLSPSEQQVLELIINSQAFTEENTFILRKLERKGIITSRDIGYVISSPLFNDYVQSRVARPHEKQEPTIRAKARLTSVHHRLFEQLFDGWYLLEWEMLQNLTPEDATVYFVQGEDAHGYKYRPCVVKIHRTDKIRDELRRTQQARDLLGPVIPNIVSSAEHDGQTAVRIEYATSDNRDLQTAQFATYYRNQSGETVADALQRLFCRILWPFYERLTVRVMSASKLYFLPRPKQNEYEQLSAIAQRSPFYNSHRHEFIIPGLPQPLLNPGIQLAPETGKVECPHSRIFGERRSAGMCLVHGDLNPRNILVDGVGHIHLIDFATTEERARFVDCTRLEAEMTYKLTEVGVDERAFLGVLHVIKLLIDANSDVEIRAIAALPFEEPLRKLMTSITSLRQIARQIHDVTSPGQDLEIEYKTALLAQTLRISLYDDYLSPQQQSLALIASSMLTQRLLYRLNRDQ